MRSLLSGTHGARSAGYGWISRLTSPRRGVVSPRRSGPDRPSVGLHCLYCEHSCRIVLPIQLAIPSPRESFPVGKRVERPWTSADVRVAGGLTCLLYTSPSP